MAGSLTRYFLEQTSHLKKHIKHPRQQLEPVPANPKFLLAEWTIGYKLAQAA